MPANERSEGTVSEEPTRNKRLPNKSEIDLQALAERVVRLLKQEARIERERLGGSRPWTKR